MKIIVASKNPVKVNAMRQAFQPMYEAPSVEGVSIDSGVSDQPFGSDETYQGALNRVNAARVEYPSADYWVGIEGGIERIGNEMHCMAWVVIASAEQTGSAKVASFLLPRCVSDLVEQGMELGEATAEHFNEPNAKQKMGVVGLLTNGRIDRTAYYVHAAELALIPFKNKKLYC